MRKEMRGTSQQHSPGHIALFISSLHKGGSERVLVNLAVCLRESGYKVTMVTQYKTDDEYPLPEGIDRVFSEITAEEETRSRALNFIRRFRKLRGIWRKLNPDLILSFIGKNNVMAILTSRFLSIPVAVSVRGEPALEYESRTLRAAARLSFGLAAGVILQSEKCLDFFPARVRRKAVVLRNPLNPTFLLPRYEGERERRIVAVGRVDANKNHELLIRAFARIADNYPDYSVTIYGNGDKRPALLELAEELGLSGRVNLPGSVADVAGSIRRAAMFVLTSDSEGMPNTLLEAMALGLPVISTDCRGGGPAELIEPGVNGLLTPVGDVEKLTDNLQKLLDNPKFAEKIGRNAAKLQEKYNPDLINRVWKDYLEGLMGRGKGLRPGVGAERGGER